MLRLLCWNVRDLRDDRAAVLRVVRSAEPDLVCLQEFPRRVRPLPRLAAFAADAGLFVAAGGRAGAGCALLAAPRVRVAGAWARRLPVPGRTDRRRGAAGAVVRPPGGPALAVAVVHLPLDADLRVRHAGLVRDLLAGRAAGGLPVVLAGDLNEPAGGPAWQAFGPLLADPVPDGGPTYPARRPRHRIDAVLAGPGVLVEPAGWRPDPDDVRAASDHLPLLVTVRPG